MLVTFMHDNNFIIIVLKARKSDKNDKNKKKVKMSIILLYPQVVSVSSVVVCGTKSLLVYS